MEDNRSVVLQDVQMALWASRWDSAEGGTFIQDNPFRFTDLMFIKYYAMPGNNGANLKNQVRFTQRVLL